MTDVLSKSDPRLLGRDRCQIGCHPVRWTYARKTYMRCAYLDRGGAAWQSVAVRSAGAKSQQAPPRHQVGQPVRILALSYQMKIGQKVHGNIATQREIAVAARRADSRDLHRALHD